MSMEEENELRQFLKVARPDWSLPRRKGQSDVVRALEKLKAIGVKDVGDLLCRVTSNTINDDLSKAHKPRFSRETIQSIRKEGAFMQSLRHLSEPSLRQIGVFAPVPQMLADRNLRIEALKTSGGTHASSMRPVTGPGSSGQQRRRSELPLAFSITGRPSTIDTASLLSSVAEDTMSLTFSTSDTPRIRPSSMALSIPYSSSLDEVDDEGDGDQGVFPRLRGTRKLKAPMRDTSHTNWKRPGFPGTGLSKSFSSPGSVGMAESSSASEFSGHGFLPPAQGGGARASLVMSSGERSLVAAGTASNTSQINEDEIDIDKVERWNKAGTTMITTPLTPGWSRLQKSESSLLQHGEAMVREQEDLQHKKKLYQQIALEGHASPMRQHLAEKIETRLREEKMRDSQALWEVKQSCMSIRQHITGMSNARKNLNTLRIETQHTLQPLRQNPAGLSLEFFKKSKQHSHDHEGEQSDAESGTELAPASWGKKSGCVCLL